MIDKTAAERRALLNQHWLLAWRENSPTPGRACALCKCCDGTIEIREDGSLVGPVACGICPDQFRAEAAQREGVSDYFARGEVIDG